MIFAVFDVLLTTCHRERLYKLQFFTFISYKSVVFERTLLWPLCHIIAIVNVGCCTFSFSEL